MTLVKRHSLDFGARRRAHPFFLSTLLAAIVSILSIGCCIAKDRLLLSTYKETRRLVSLVEDAATLMEREGENAFKRFGQKDSRWLNEDYYRFVYALDRPCIFHPIAPEFVAKNTMAAR